MLALRSTIAPFARRTGLRYFAAGSDLNKSLSDQDPELCTLIEQEKARQRNSLVLIASENFTSKAVLDADPREWSNVPGSVSENASIVSLFVLQQAKPFLFQKSYWHVDLDVGDSQGGCNSSGLDQELEL